MGVLLFCFVLFFCYAKRSLSPGFSHNSNSLAPSTKLKTPVCQRSLRSVLEQEEAVARAGFAQGADDSAQVAAGEEAFTDSSPRFLADRNRGDRRGC